MKIKRLFKFILYGLIAITICYIGLWIAYYFTANQYNKELRKERCSEGKQYSFNGKIVNLNRYEYSDNMSKKYIGLIVQTLDSASSLITYQVELTNQKDILDFVQIGQTIIKEKNSSKFILLDSLNKSKEYKIWCCD
jgi:hypothetical protein